MTELGAGRRLLLVEDNEADIALVEEILEEIGFSGHLTVARNGSQAIDAVRECSPETLPDLIMLDLNLPLVDGRKVLAELKADRATRHIVISVFSTSAAASDIAECYALHANSFITKPGDIECFTETLRNLLTYWFVTVSLGSGAP